MEFLSAFLDSHWMEHVRRSATVFILQPRGPACIPARTEHAPLVASTRDHHDSHHAPPEPCRYVRAARPRLASSRSRAAAIVTADRRLRSPSEIRSREIYVFDRATQPLASRRPFASAASSDPPRFVFPVRSPSCLRDVRSLRALRDRGHRVR